MISKDELLEAIASCERAPVTYQNCEKLATFYAIYDHMYADPARNIEPAEVAKIEASGKSDFLQAINGATYSKVWPIIDELMQTLQVLQPRLYDGVMRRLEDI